MTTDFRALCAELLSALENEGYAHWVHTPDEDELCLCARAALAEPEPEGPTDEELTQLLFEGFRGPIEFLCEAEEEAHLMIRNHVRFARAVLARWGQPL